MVSSLRKPRFALPIRFASEAWPRPGLAEPRSASIAGFGNTEPLSSREQKGEDGHDQDKGLVLGSFFVKLCTAKLCLENRNKTYRDQSYPKAFPQIHKREVKLSVLSRSNHSRQQATLQHTLCFSRSGLSQRMSLGVKFKYCLKVTKTK